MKIIELPGDTPESLKEIENFWKKHPYGAPETAFYDEDDDDEEDEKK